jgi:hypothetical protein
LFGDLEGNGLHRLDGCDGARAHVLIQPPLTGEFRCDLLALVVGAGDLDDLASIQGDLAHLDRRNEAGDKRPEFHPRARGVCRIGNGDIPRGSGHHFSDACLLQRRNRHGGLPVFEGGGGSLPLVLDVDIWGNPASSPGSPRGSAACRLRRATG